jgi:enoyl-CoA hydratase/carnithine racemase
MTSAPVLVTEAAGIVSITINRPEARNSLNTQTIKLLTEAFERATANSLARCVVLSGAGTEAFCAGADIAELVNNPTPSARRAFFDSIASLIEKINLCPVPVVARVHGFALAGGCGLAAACDITLAADDAVFGLPEVGVGLAAMVVMAPLSRVVQKKALIHMVMTGERISASRALDIGLVTAVHAKASLDRETDALCEKLSKQGPQALKASKQALLDVTEREYLPLLHELADRSALLSLGSEATEGLTAFTQKREPSWRKS